MGNTDEVRYVHLRPDDFQHRLQVFPVAYLPLGTLEWHGRHMPLGSDAILSESLMIEAAKRFGGIVLPPIHLGPDSYSRRSTGPDFIGMDKSEFTQPQQQLPGSAYWISEGTFLLIIESILEQLSRAGFKMVFADGHGPSRNLWVRSIKANEERFGMRLLGVTPEDYGKWQSQMDHAGTNETSLMMHYHENLVDLSVLGEDMTIHPNGTGFEDPRNSNAATGQRCKEASLDWLEQQLTGLL